VTFRWLAAERPQLIIVSRAYSNCEYYDEAVAFQIFCDWNRISSVRKAVGDENYNFFTCLALCVVKDFLESF
jgi:hypothetical protein